MNSAALLLSLLLLSFTKSTQSIKEVSEVILLPLEWNKSNETVPLSFTAFGKQIDLLLKKNENLLTPSFEVWKRKDDNVLNKVDDFAKSSSCHYLHEDSIISAAVSLCDFGTVHGFVFFENDSLEITPLGISDQSDIFKSHRIQVRSSSSFGEPHVVKRRRIPSYREAQAFNAQRNRVSPRFEDNLTQVEDEKIAASSLTIELAVFLDATAYDLYHSYFSGDELKLIDLLLAYVNNIQALYYHPSLGRRVDIALVRLELFEHQPPELSKLDGERNGLLDTFCAYSKARNPLGDDDPRHWDMGLYISGLDFYALEDGKRNPVTMGLAPVGGVCWEDYSCVIAEFGVTNRFGKPYPSAGFTSVYIAAHEIAHNLGMHHDSSDNDCPKDGYIMSPSRGTQGESQWSSCSRTLVSTLPRTKACLLDYTKPESRQRGLDHSGRYAELPGRHWTAKRQCELLLREPDAYADTIDHLCRGIRCKSTRRTGFYMAGPALDGTKCADGRECRAGECLPVEDRWEVIPPLTTPSAAASGWSEWSSGTCRSGCIRGSLGFLERRRTCLGDTDCPGLGFDVSLCKDSQTCASRKRVSAKEHASQRCLEFAGRLDAIIDARAGGLQAEHENERPWVACAIFCRRSDLASYYSPKLELNDLGVDPYFPDGTWCHTEDGEDYFCRRHHCLPESFRFGKGLPPTSDEELPMNAGPSEDYWRPAAEVIRYLSLGLDGKPLLTRLPEGKMTAGPDDEDAWIDTKDYVELPHEFLLRRLGDNYAVQPPRFI